ncbi:MAG: hypothetical protein KJ645_07410 [Planctomycetes bacterium]|nr:hypothetical protein [Planctomycetota bacterium]
MITFVEHFSLFALLSLLVTLVYSGLRQDDLKKIVCLALKRFTFFMLASAVLGVAAYYFAAAL